MHKSIFEEVISVRIHAAHVSAPGSMQEHTPGKLCIGFVPGVIPFADTESCGQKN